MSIRSLFWLAAAMIVALPHQGALAAPQILAVLATNDGISFACDDGVCEAGLSAYCLQRNRPAPEFGTEYAPAAPDTFTLVVMDATGGERRLPAAEYVVFFEDRGYTSVSARLSEARLAELGAVRATIEVGADASLVPAPRAGDSDPLTDDEIAYTVGPLRALGTRIVDDSAEAGAARLVATMINALPPTGRVGAERRAALWGDVPGADAAGATESAGLSRARSEFDWCLGAIAEPRVFSMRSCLETRHDQLMRELNVDFWNADVGS